MPAIQCLPSRGRGSNPRPVLWPDISHRIAPQPRASCGHHPGAKWRATCDSLRERCADQTCKAITNCEGATILKLEMGGNRSPSILHGGRGTPYWRFHSPSAISETISAAPITATIDLSRSGRTRGGEASTVPPIFLPRHVVSAHVLPPYFSHGCCYVVAVTTDQKGGAR